MLGQVYLNKVMEKEKKPVFFNGFGEGFKTSVIQTKGGGERG